PLGQGIANAVGRIGSCRETLGSCSHPGHWGLGKLIAFYDDNRISIDGDTEIAFTERIDKRFEGLGWHVIWSRMGTLAMMKFVPLLRKQRQTRKVLMVVHWVPSKWMLLGKNLDGHLSLSMYLKMLKSKEDAALEAEWDAKFVEYEKKYRVETVDLNLIITGELPAGWEKALSLLNSVKHNFRLMIFVCNIQAYTLESPTVATQNLPQQNLNVLVKVLPGLLGGSDTPKECNVRFGVREHGMGAICDAIALHSPGLIPYCATFLSSLTT
ncbi:hypothetical protein Goklo_014270, partial [Gossypium klotzschianum]|nr:hypothetical protein [Gossypium klotzschianum]